MSLFSRSASRAASVSSIPQRSFSSRRVDRRGAAVLLTRADLSDEALEKEVRKGLDKEGDYTKGDVPLSPLSRPRPRLFALPSPPRFYPLCF